VPVQSSSHHHTLYFSYALSKAYNIPLYTSATQVVFLFQAFQLKCYIHCSASSCSKVALLDLIRLQIFGEVTYEYYKLSVNVMFSTLLLLPPS
jgi:hypothetical protein